MASRHKKKDASAERLTLKLPNILDMRSMELWHSQLLQACEQPGNIHIQAQESEHIVTAAFQLLVAADKSLQEQQRTLHIESPSDTLRTTAQTLGLASFIEERSTNHG